MIGSRAGWWCLQAVYKMLVSHVSEAAGYGEACTPYMELLRWMLGRKPDAVVRGRLTLTADISTHPMSSHCSVAFLTAPIIPIQMLSVSVITSPPILWSLTLCATHLA